MKEIITLDQYWMGRDVQFPKDCTDEVKTNAIKLLKAINGILTDLGVEKVSVTSGWRPAAINAQITNAAKRSAHMIGLACDILDNPNQDLAKLVANHPNLLKKYNLWMEDMGSTKGKNQNWLHLDLMTRQDRPSRVFHP